MASGNKGFHKNTKKVSSRDEKRMQHLKILTARRLIEEPGDMQNPHKKPSRPMLETKISRTAKARETNKKVIESDFLISRTGNTK